MTDQEYDNKFKVFCMNKDKVVSVYKDLISQGVYSGSMFFLKKEDYPEEIVKLNDKFSTINEFILKV